MTKPRKTVCSTFAAAVKTAYDDYENRVKKRASQLKKKETKPKKKPIKKSIRKSTTPAKKSSVRKSTTPAKKSSVRKSIIPEIKNSIRKSVVVGKKKPEYYDDLLSMLEYPSKGHLTEKEKKNLKELDSLLKEFN